MFEKIHASTIDKYMEYKRIFGHYDENYKGKNYPRKLSLIIFYRLFAECEAEIFQDIF